MKLQEKISYFQVAFAVMVWGSAYPFTKYLLNEISPFSIVFYRACLGVLFLIILAKPKILLSDFNFSMILKLLLMSVLGVSLQQYTQAYALKYTLATSAGWLITTIPIFVVLLEFVLGERISKNKIFGFFLGFCGTLIVILSRDNFRISFLSSKGDLIFLSSCLAWAFYVILTKRWFLKDSQSKITALTMLVAFISLIPPFFYLDYHREFAALSAKGLFSLFYLGVFSSALAYLFWNNSVSSLGPIRSSYFIYMQPFSTITVSYFYIGETVKFYAFIGGIAILAGVYFVNREKNKMKPAVENGL